jgi:hypothetical protein
MMNRTYLDCQALLAIAALLVIVAMAWKAGI